MFAHFFSKLALYSALNAFCYWAWKRLLNTKMANRRLAMVNESEIFLLLS